jgi:hypothetical protein
MIIPFLIWINGSGHEADSPISLTGSVTEMTLKGMNTQDENNYAGI